MDLLSFLSFGNSKNRTNRKAGQNRKHGMGREWKASKPELEPLEDRMLLSSNIISGNVFVDVNKDGIYDAGDTPIANNPLELRNDQGVVVGTTTTDANGYYQFDHDQTVNTDVTTIDQTVNIDPTVAGFSLSRQVKQFDPSLGQLVGVEIINQGSITSDIRAENTSTLVGATINGVVSGKIILDGPGFSLENDVSNNAGTFNATQFDGIIDFAGTSGVQFDPKTATSNSKSITLTGSQMTPFIGTGQVSLTENADVNSTVSGGGNVVFGVSSSATANFTVRYMYTPDNSLSPGNYTIVQTQQPSLNNGTSDLYLDGPEYQNGVMVPGSVGTDQIKVSLANANLINNNFTEVAPASLSGFVYNDQNNDGIKQNDTLPSGQPREPGIGGVSVTLTGTNDIGQQVQQTTTTAADGSYKFDKLRPGTYSVQEQQPTGYASGKNSVGTLGGTASNDLFSNIVVNGGAVGQNYDFAERLATDVSIVKTVTPSSVLAGDTLTYLLTLSNLGPNTANNVQVNDTLPKGVNFISADAPGWNMQNNAGQLSFTRDSMTNGSSSTIQITASAPDLTGNYVNTATVATSTPDINLNNNQSSATVTVSQPDPPADPPDPPPDDEVLSKALVLSSSDFWFKLMMGT